ncbi:MAG: A/G-specific adenine glycosylase [Ferruginibacter sp.]|nr:A/G-specific adenine glycosylase [Ferruginibacter sp.]
MAKGNKKNVFTENLLLWHKNENNRLMPWKGENDPYKIWLSEIILQQTRVEQGKDYYYKFIDKFATIHELAQANENDVFKLWEGLGYYSRCKNLIATAQFISFELGGVFPTKYLDLLKLKGIGPYTASAIASFAYNLPHAVVDGNVLRVLARYFEINTPIDSAEGKNNFAVLANDLLNKEKSAIYNQAIMDFGATICKPKQPLCTNCIMQQNCKAFYSKTVTALPVKQNKITKKLRFFYYLIAEYNSNIYVQKRTEKDIWQNLWEFILFEKENKIEAKEIFISKDFKNEIGDDYKICSISKFYKQQLTHQTIEGVFIHLILNSPIKNSGYIALSKNEIKQVAFPRFITKYFEA